MYAVDDTDNAPDRPFCNREYTNLKRRTVRADFVDFWPNFFKADNYFYHLLGTAFNVEINGVDPDVVFFSIFGNEKKRYEDHRSQKIFFCGENRSSNLYPCDLSFTFEETDGKNVYLPLWVLFLNWFNVPYNNERDISCLIDIERLMNPTLDVDAVLKRKTEFCSFVVKNPKAKERIRFCKTMQKRARVDCPGTVLNNYPPIGGRGDQVQKLDFLERYRFNIAFENAYHPGYVTEKIIQPMAANCLPIYWGGERVLEYFNKDAFVWCGDFGSTGEIIDRVLEIDGNRDLYVSMITRPVFSSDLFMREFNPQAVLRHLLEKEIV
jgi:hypothetical protein